jgi:hypothetical protein
MENPRLVVLQLLPGCPVVQADKMGVVVGLGVWVGVEMTAVVVRAADNAAPRFKQP